MSHSLTARAVTTLAIDAPDERAQLVEALNAEVVGLAMEPDAIRVLVLIARRLNFGRPQYGDLNLDTDLRDMEAEALDEDADGLVYRAAETLRQMKRARRG